MPMVQITMLEGRSAEQKRKMAQRITDVLVEEAAARREAIGTGGIQTLCEIPLSAYRKFPRLRLHVLASPSTLPPKQPSSAPFLSTELEPSPVCPFQPHRLAK